MSRSGFCSPLFKSTCLAAVLMFHCQALLPADTADTIISFSPIPVGAHAIQIRQVNKATFSFAITTGDFQQTNDCASSVTDTCNVSVTFSPTASGLRAGVLMIEGSNFLPLQIIGLS